MPRHASLLLTPTADAALSPEQRKFNQLVRKVEQARAEHSAWQAQIPLYGQAHAQRIRPLLAELASARQAAAYKLDTLLTRPGWTKAECRTMQQVICDVAAGLIEDDATSEALAAQLKALFDKHADVDFDTENRQAVAAMKDLFETMTGVSLGDGEFESEDDLMQHAHERVNEERSKAQAAAEAGANKPKARRKAGRPSAAQQRREQEEQQASQSVREVYRKLASALHPDRADDEADRAERTARMQRLNQAYEAKDLLALLTLQLEIEQVDAAHIATATAERARHYNRVLADQLTELKMQVQALQAGFCVDFGYDLHLRPSPHKLGLLLNREAAELNAALAQAQRDLRQLDDPAGVKRWLKRMRQQQQADEADMRFGPFF
jgi:hypothetical protein